MRRFIIACLIAFLPTAALAQTPKPRPFVPTGDAVKDIKNAIGGQHQGSDEGGGVSTSNAGAADLLNKPFQDLANFIGEDIDGAISLSIAIPSIQDGHGQQCFLALKVFGDVIKAHPAPLTFHIATDLEALRLKQIAFNNLCGNPHCTQVFADLATTVQVAAPVGFSVPIPSLHDICAKVPQIAVAAPVTPTPPP
jgi:hypothetical protein